MRYKVEINEEFCKGCGYCVVICPREVIKLSEGMNKRGYHFVVAVREDRCIGCKSCEYTCPDFAIFVHPKKEGE
ncbi:MAG: 4Fe-4S dicluster domain-containing protein [Candidatus Asgardarchaeia archaeon]